MSSMGLSTKEPTPVEEPVTQKVQEPEPQPERKPVEKPEPEPELKFEQVRPRIRMPLTRQE